jgi:hypothetical protein
MNCPEMSGLTARQQRGLTALLASNSAASAAKQAKVAERTLRRWLAEPAFRAAYQHASRRMFDDAIGHLRAATGEAVRTLREALLSDNDGVKIRAALGILDAAVKCDLDDLIERVERLERGGNDTSLEGAGNAAVRATNGTSTTTSAVH